ncbi:MAG: aminotransferase class IV family protein, partial [Deltaproteobacteria bacterium]|nr:aminotransferase class IV family protein [Deltaproteobacteria bacterium]
RLSMSAKKLKIPFKQKGLKNTIKKLLELNGLIAKDSCLKIILTRGTDKAIFLPAKKTKPTLLIMAYPIDIKTIRKNQEHGVDVILVSDTPPIINGLKTLNCLRSIIARMEADEKGADEAVFTDKKMGFLEGTSSNIFFVKDGTIKTPPLSTGILPGITRLAVIKLAKKNGIPLEETLVRNNKPDGFDEVFLTNSIIEITPVVRINGSAVGKGRVGKVARTLQEAYRSYAPQNPLTPVKKNPRART